MREVGEGGINTKKAIINYHHRAAATGVGWGGGSLTKDQFVTAPDRSENEGRRDADPRYKAYQNVAGILAIFIAPSRRAGFRRVCVGWPRGGRPELNCTRASRGLQYNPPQTADRRERDPRRDLTRVPLAAHLSRTMVPPVRGRSAFVAFPSEKRIPSATRSTHPPAGGKIRATRTSTDSRGAQPSAALGSSHAA